MRKHVTALALCALSLAPALAARAADAPVAYRPCDRKPTPSDTEAARGLFQAGKVSYEEADYPKAISLWRDAYERDCTAVLLLKNLAGAYEKANNLEAAIITLDTYIKRDPDNAEIPTLRKRIENMRRAQAAAAATASATPTATTTAPAPTATTTAPPPPTDTAPATGGSRPITPLIVAGGGAVVGITGLVVFLVGLNKYNDASDSLKALRGPDNRTPAGKEAEDASLVDKGKSGQNLRTAGSIIGYSGLGIAAIGGVWYLLSKPEPATTTTGRFFTPNVAPGYAGFSYGGAF